MTVNVKFLPQTKSDLNKLDNGDKRYILSAIEKLIADIQSGAQSSYGKPLGNSGQPLFYVKIMGTDIRIVYQLLPYGNDFILLFVEFTKAKTHGNVNLKKQTHR